VVVNKPAAVPDVNTVLAKAAKPETVAVVTTIGEETARQSGKVFMQTVADDNGASWMRKSFYDDKAGLHEFEFALRVWRHDQLRGNQLILQPVRCEARVGCAFAFMTQLGVDMTKYTRGLQGLSALRFLPKAVQALETVHSANVFHGDIKTENMIVLGDGTFRLTDFGLAGALDSWPRHVRGTPGFRYPWETTAGPAATDAWALGCVAYEFATGSRLFTVADIMELSVPTTTEFFLKLFLARKDALGLADVIVRDLTKTTVPSMMRSLLEFGASVEQAAFKKRARASIQPCPVNKLSKSARKNKRHKAAKARQRQACMENLTALTVG
jgi:hypothetical protein